MNQLKDKIRLLYIPFLLTLIGLIVVYTFLNWLIFIKLELFSVKKIITEFVLPITLAFLCSVLLRPRFKILYLETKKGSDWRDFYTGILWIILFIPLMIAQSYIVTATGKLTELNSINEINQHQLTKYYTLKNYYIDKERMELNYRFDAEGRRNENFVMSLYIVLPVFEKKEDAANSEPLAWFGVKYNKKISNRIQLKEKELELEQFTKESLTDLFNRDISEFEYLDNIGNSDDKEGFVEAIKKHQIYHQSGQIILLPVNKPFETRSQKSLFGIWCSALIGSIVWLVMILIPRVDEKHLKRIKAGKPDRQAQLEMKEFLEFLIPQQGHFVTMILIYVNIFIFLIMAIKGLGFVSFKGGELLNWGANYGPLVKEGEWWRLLTSTFLHGGIMHLLANMYGLLFVGIFLEPVLGRIKFLGLYLLTGILASLTSIWWHDATLSVGASGAIFGLYGIFLAFLLVKIYPPDFSKAFLVSTIIFIGFNLLMGLTGGIDNAAHIGGLASGFIIGLVFSQILFLKNKKR